MRTTNGIKIGSGVQLINPYGNGSAPVKRKKDTFVYKKPENYLAEEIYRFTAMDFINDKFVVVIDNGNGLLGKIGKITDIHNLFATFKTEDGITTKIDVRVGMPLSLLKSIKKEAGNCIPKFSFQATFGNEHISYSYMKKLA